VRLAQLAQLDEERAAIMVDAGVPRVWWKQHLEDVRVSGLTSGRGADCQEVHPDPRCSLRLGKNTSTVPPREKKGDFGSPNSALVAAGQVALPGEPAQLDFARTPLALPPAPAAAAAEPAPIPPAQLAIPGIGPEQLELNLQRRRRHELANGLRSCARPRVSKCGRVRVVPALEIRMTEGRAHFRGLLTCGSVWECPHCSAKIRAGRATEVQDAVAWHGAERTSMLTLTVRHGMGDDLKELRSGVANAWRLMQQGAPWTRFRERVGLVGTIRALEVTHGPNGWHPHLHLLVLVRDPAQLEREREWLAIRWRNCVARLWMWDNVPDLEHGCVLTPCHESNYIAKLGLELAGGVKDGREGHRTPWQIAQDAVAGDADCVLWRTYCDGIFGARMLTWSKGLRAAAGLLEQTDEDVAAAEDPDASTVCRIPGATWDALRADPAIIVALLEAAEHGGAQCVHRLISRVLYARRVSASPASGRAPPS
jgi:hypothetical protein